MNKMNVFYWGGRGMPSEQRDQITPLRSHKPSSPMLTYRSLLLVFVICLFNVAASGQSRTESEAATEVVEIKPLEIGDTIPEELWHMPLQVVNHPDGKDTITLNDYRDKKLIILDFWATWCAPCIVSLKKLSAYEKELDDFAVVPVTLESSETIVQRMPKHMFEPFSIYNGQNLPPYFPHRSIPHQIWIQSGKIIHVGGSDSGTKENILAVLSNKEINADTKVEILDFDPETPLQYYADRTQSKKYLQTSLTGPIKGIGTRSATRHGDNNTLFFFHNRRILDAYKQHYAITPNRIQVESQDSILSPTETKNFLNNRFCFQLQVGEILADSLCTEQLIEQMEKAFDLHHTWKSIDRQVYTIVKKPESDVRSVEASRDHRFSMRQLLETLNYTDNWNDGLPVYVYSGDEDMLFRSISAIGQITTDERHLRDMLAMNGYELKKEIQPTTVLSISKK